MRNFVLLAASAAMCIAAPAFAKNGGSHGSSGGNSHSGGGSQGNGGNGGNGGGNSQPGNGGGSQSNGGNGGGSNSTPVACSVNDISVAALACSGFYAGNILNGNDVAAQVAGLAAIGVTWDGNYSALDSAGRKQDLNGATQFDFQQIFGQKVYGITVLGIHFGGGGANGVGNGTAFYKFDAGAGGTDLLSLNYPGSSGIALYSTGHAPISPPHDTVPSVPEPASWMMLLAGFGLIGGLLRSSRKTTVRFA